MALQMAIILEGISWSPLPGGQLVTSRVECVSVCHFNPGCVSILYDGHVGHCFQMGAAINATDLGAGNMQYLTWGQTHPLRGCPTGYTYDERVHVCYKVVTEADVWSDAEDDCLADGAHLMKVDSEDMNTITYQRCVEAGGTHLWVGGNDHMTEGNWTWADNSPMDYTAWKPGEPSATSVNENCMSLRCDGVLIGDWWDKPCDTDYNYICQTQIREINLC